VSIVRKLFLQYLSLFFPNIGPMFRVICESRSSLRKAVLAAHRTCILVCTIRAVGAAVGASVVDELKTL
jgi:hypothetical protein